MPVTKTKGLPSGRGERDAQHHKDRVRRQITDHLREHIGGEDIITGDGRIKVPVTGSKRYNFIFDRGKGGGQGPGGSAGNEPGAEDYEVWLDMAEVEEMLFAELALPRLKPKKTTDAETIKYRFDTIAIKGPQVDKRATLRRSLLRNSIQGTDDFQKDDLRYMSYREQPKPKSKAVVFLAMDVSGSMGPKEKQIARLFDYWTVRFLRHRYDTVEIVFISHTSEAKEVTEHEFFNRVESGGTMVSSAYKLIQEIQSQRYPESDWNIYVLHASDGDNWQIDNDDVYKAIEALCKICSLVGYLEITTRGSLSGYGMWNTSTTLMDAIKAKGSPGKEFMFAQVANEKEIWGAIRHFFAKDEVDGSVNE